MPIFSCLIKEITEAEPHAPHRLRRHWMHHDEKILNSYTRSLHELLAEKEKK